jgi:hypothetical protein
MYMNHQRQCLVEEDLHVHGDDSSKSLMLVLGLGFDDVG